MLVIFAIGVALTALYSVEFASRFPLLPWWRSPLLDFSWFTGYSLAGQVRYVADFGVLFALYYLAYLLLRRRPAAGPLWLVLAGQLLMALPLILMYPIAANDVYDYVLYGRIELYSHGNPLAHPPSQYPGEPMTAYSYWPNEPSVYGPLWQALSARLTDLVDGQLPDGLFAFKIAALLAGLATTTVLWLCLRRARPRAAASGALLFAWNPLQLFETAGNAHNDALMALFLALALLALYQRRVSLGPLSFAAGLLTKITMAPLAPIVALAALCTGGTARRAVSHFALGCLLALGLTLLLYAPYWEGRSSLPFLDRGNWFTASPPTLLRELFRRWQAFEVAGRSAATLSGLVFVAAAAWVVAHHWRARGCVETWTRVGYHVFFLYLVLACLWWQPWYLITLLVLAALLPDRALHDRANLFCFGGLMSYPMFKYIWAVHQTDWQLDYFRIMAMSVVVIFTLPLAHVVATWLPRSAPRWRSSDRTG
ncbi:MAG: glycosyltransferase family 39 protein [Chloroflexi bacterium]|nr:glycosyltransferase family 39 protein [Chloroflexota bacterium]